MAKLDPVIPRDKLYKLTALTLLVYLLTKLGINIPDWVLSLKQTVLP
jgi:hypothetical protein